jgi:hypothetical protein
MRQAIEEAMDEDISAMLGSTSLESLSLGGVAAIAPQSDLPKKYRKPRPGEVSTFQGAGIVPVCRLASGEVRVLLWQPQHGKKKGVRWYDFGGRKNSKQEFTSYCACRKFAKQTYGIFGCQINIIGASSEQVGEHLAELYQGLSNLPLMLRASQEWAQMQLLDDNSKVFYNDIHEYHIYMLNVPYVPADILGAVSEIVDGGKRVFKWLSKEDFAEEVLAPRLHSESFANQVMSLADDPWVRQGQAYGDQDIRSATGCFSATVV